MSDELATQAEASEIALTTAPGSLIPSFTPAATADLFGTLASGGTFYPRVQLFGSNSSKVIDGKIGLGHYGMTADKDTLIDLGVTFDCLVISFRPMAMATQDDPIVSTHDRHSELFKSIEKRANTEKDSGCIYGPEFLIWLPTLKKFATYMFGSKSARREAPHMYGLLSKAATLKVKLVSHDKYKWHVPVIVACSTPFEMPDHDDLKATADDFNNPVAFKAPEPIKEEAAQSERVV